MLQINETPEVYGPCVVFENGKNLICRRASGNIWDVASSSFMV